MLPTSSVLIIIIIFFYVTSDNIFKSSLTKIKLFIEYFIILNFSCRPNDWMIDILQCVSLFLLQSNIVFIKLCHYSYYINYSISILYIYIYTDIVFNIYFCLFYLEITYMNIYNIMIIF